MKKIKPADNTLYEANEVLDHTFMDHEYTPQIDKIAEIINRRSNQGYFSASIKINDILDGEEDFYNDFINPSNPDIRIKFFEYIANVLYNLDYNIKIDSPLNPFNAVIHIYWSVINIFENVVIPVNKEKNENDNVR